MDTVEALMARWADEARRLRDRYALESAARVCEAHVRELREVLSAQQDALLTVAEAAAECGYSRQHLRALLASGDLPNAGRRGRPRIRRADLPSRKPTSKEPPADSATRANPRPRQKEFDARRIVRGG